MTGSLENPFATSHLQRHGNTPVLRTQSNWDRASSSAATRSKKLVLFHLLLGWRSQKIAIAIAAFSNRKFEIATLTAGSAEKSQKHRGMKSQIAAFRNRKFQIAMRFCLSNSKDKSKVPKLSEIKNRCDFFEQCQVVVSLLMIWGFWGPGVQTSWQSSVRPKTLLRCTLKW